MTTTSLRRSAVCAALALLPLSLSACSAGSPGSPGREGEGTTISFLVDNSPDTVAAAEQLAEDFMAENEGITVHVETRPGGSEGDDVVRTRLRTGSMPDVFLYDSGALFQQIAPQQHLTPLTGEPFLDAVDEDWKERVSAGGEVYGVPFGTSSGGGVLYNRAVYEELDLQVPRTWDEFMANNEEIEAAGIVPVIQTYRDTWTSQLPVLGDFHNVSAADPEWAEKYTANQVGYATDPNAIKGFQHLQELHQEGMLNPDFATAGLEEGLRMLAEGEGAHYPMLTEVVGTVAADDPGQVDDVGFFALPGDDPAANGLTAWYAHSLYVPNTVEGEELEAAKEFLAFIASPAGCESQSRAAVPTGPYPVEGCELPEDVPQVTEDVSAYFEDGNVSPALEFLSPVKGPSLERITVEVGSGLRSAADGAALYDRDVEEQAKQLGLEGW